jgi:hypothetical protein
MKGKIYTPDEATLMLPLVSRIADDIVATYARVHQALRELEAAKARHAEAEAASTGTEVPHPDDRATALARLDATVARRLDAFQGLVEEIEALGGTVKDYERGCIDFYGEVDGEIVYLCWQRGEESISHWHALDEGYADRHPIEVPNAA